MSDWRDAKNPPREPYRPVLPTSRDFDDDLLELRAAAVRDYNGEAGLFRMAFEHTARQMVLRSLTDEEIAALGLRVMVSGSASPAPLQEALRAFFGKCWDAARDGYREIGGDDVQEWAEELGLLVKIRREKPCGEGCHCEEYVGVDFPTDCYVPFDRDEGRAALAGTSPPPEKKP